MGWEDATWGRGDCRAVELYCRTVEPHCRAVGDVGLSSTVGDVELSGMSSCRAVELSGFPDTRQPDILAVLSSPRTCRGRAFRSPQWPLTLGWKLRRHAPHIRGAPLRHAAAAYVWLSQGGDSIATVPGWDLGGVTGWGCRAVEYCRGCLAFQRRFRATLKFILSV
eukprot:gene18414-biopygen15977